MPESESKSIRGREASIDQLFREVQAGSHGAFSAWVRAVEIPLRSSLRSFAARVDVEAIVQEVLMRMWRWAPDLRLEGTHGSLRYAIVVARNMAIAETRRSRRAAVPAEPPPVPAPAIPDFRLREAISRCLEKLAGKPRLALLARLDDGGMRSDEDLATMLGMRANTFLQNIVRARAAVKDCLRRAGYRIEEYLP